MRRAARPRPPPLAGMGVPCCPAYLWRGWPVGDALPAFSPEVPMASPRDSQMLGPFPRVWRLAVLKMWPRPSSSSSSSVPQKS